ncbi:hypothetical protein BDV41DRAFT_546331 [Aspergillus transmontanensis]|uniref:NADP-dependent oxidoreductase domain-containing protein n=1 Tax=Aspergillus transmontanensis TaxID=1034304 RepID=A0A5N6VNF7_9EURO|nr:hypothetical protein BDV41DRAFT_546331 [Aspergillus transmontanensis]
MKNTSASTNDIVGTCIGQSDGPLDSRLAVTLDETQQIFGRGILRIQSHGPRHAIALTYVMAKALNVIPLVGGRKVEYLHDNIQALSIKLTEDQIEYLESI